MWTAGVFDGGPSGEQGSVEVSSWKGSRGGRPAPWGGVACRMLVYGRETAGDGRRG